MVLIAQSTVDCGQMNHIFSPTNSPSNEKKAFKSSIEILSCREKEVWDSKKSQKRFPPKKTTPNPSQALRCVFFLPVMSIK